MNEIRISQITDGSISGMNSVRSEIDNSKYLKRMKSLGENEFQESNEDFLKVEQPELPVMNRMTGN